MPEHPNVQTFSTEVEQTTKLGCRMPSTTVGQTDKKTRPKIDPSKESLNMLIDSGGSGQ